MGRFSLANWYSNTEYFGMMDRLIVANAQAGDTSEQLQTAIANAEIEAEKAKQLEETEKRRKAAEQGDLESEQNRIDKQNRMNENIIEEQITDPTVIYDKDGTIKSKYDLLKTKLYGLSNDQNEDIVVARWNTYYYKKYKLESNFLMYIIAVCIIIILLTFLHKTFPYFDRPAYLIIVGFIIGISILFFTYFYYRMFMKDDMNFDENDNGPATINRIRADQSTNDYVDICFNDISNCNPDPRHLEKSNFLNKFI